MNIIIEVCCGSADDVLQAKKAGIARVELNSSLFLGGLTPTLGALTLAKDCGMEVMAMVRPREGGFCYTQAEYETMLLDARFLLDHGADGIVFGFLHPDGTVDVARCRAMMDVIGDHTSVFHRAIDVVPDWRVALDALIDLGVTRVLTSGQAPSVHYGAPVVRAMVERAQNRIQILPGAGIQAENLRDVLAQTGCDQFHVAALKSCSDPSTLAHPDIFYGGALYPPETRFSMADSAQLAVLAALANP